MKIRIKENAGRLYRGGFVLQQIPNWEWAKTLDAVQGMTLEVETKFLFSDQFNTAPVPGVSVSGLRLMAESVDEVIDDERIGKIKCRWCGHCQDVQLGCGKCGKNDYLEGLSNESKISLDYMERAKAERDAGGSIEFPPGGLYIAINCSDDS